MSETKSLIPSLQKHSLYHLHFRSNNNPILPDPLTEILRAVIPLLTWIVVIARPWSYFWQQFIASSQVFARLALSSVEDFP